MADPITIKVSSDVAVHLDCALPDHIDTLEGVIMDHWYRGQSMLEKAKHLEKQAKAAECEAESLRWHAEALEVERRKLIGILGCMKKTHEIFDSGPTPEDLAAMDEEELAEIAYTGLA